MFSTKVHAHQTVFDASAYPRCDVEKLFARCAFPKGRRPENRALTSSSLCDLGESLSALPD